MDILMDENGQGAAEYILLFGGVIVIAIAALIIYQNYFSGSPEFVDDDLGTVRTNVARERS
ncbi:class III signal peptide-containing protein [Methanobacterium alkalithermotolerans]|uniref:Class III signal peptide-containing protein n=1 Tax=Methanobacterium alkalithermotolerans TaxID=2731220 RepID=A0A8T8K5M6_9EURY|nr:class III signal peptide-containing protein [Methanobacterium alkalithermotolerans]QUH23886.1 class III signal peptide-containing protein [Methanobacterium alkalithermotolerans]